MNHPELLERYTSGVSSPGTPASRTPGGSVRLAAGAGGGARVF